MYGCSDSPVLPERLHRDLAEKGRLLLDSFPVYDLCGFDHHYYLLKGIPHWECKAGQLEEGGPAIIVMYLPVSLASHNLFCLVNPPPHFRSCQKK